MKLSKEGQEALEFIREKVAAKNSVMNGQEADCLGLVFKEIQAFYNVKVSHIIDRSCNSCIMQALKIVYNFITYHEVKPIDRTAKVIEVSRKIALSEIDEKTPAGVYEIVSDYSELKHWELKVAMKNAGLTIPKNASLDTMIKLLNENK